MTRAFVDPPVEQPRWHYCNQCGDAYDPQRGHACEPAGRVVLTLVISALLIGLFVLIVKHT